MNKRDLDYYYIIHKNNLKTNLKKPTMINPEEDQKFDKKPNTKTSDWPHLNIQELSEYQQPYRV